MDGFKKITEDFYYEVSEKNEDIRDYLVDNVSINFLALRSDSLMSLEYSIVDCESPVEQLFSLYLEDSKLYNIEKFNPFIDVLDIKKQESIQCGNNNYRVDFCIYVNYKKQGIKCFVIECDGHEFHQKTKEQVEKDNTRTRNLQKAGYEVIRFSGTEIWHKPRKCVDEIINIILSKCKYNKGGKDDGPKKDV